MKHEMIWGIEVDTSTMTQEDIDVLEDELASLISNRLGKDKVIIKTYEPMLIGNLEDFYREHFVQSANFQTRLDREMPLTHD